MYTSFSYTHSWPRQLNCSKKYRNHIFKTGCVTFALFKIVELSQTDIEVHRLRGTNEIDRKNDSETGQTSQSDQGNCQPLSFIASLTFASVYHVFHHL